MFSKKGIYTFVLVLFAITQLFGETIKYTEKNADGYDVYYVSLEDFCNIVSDEYKIQNRCDLKGSIRSYAYAKKAEKLVIVESLNMNYIVHLYNNEGQELWVKEFKSSNYYPLIYISDNAETIVLNTISLSKDEKESSVAYILDSSGNLITQSKETSNYLSVSPDGNSIYNIAHMKSKYPHKEIEVFDKHLNKINLNGFIKDNSYVGQTFLSDSLIVCGREYSETDKYLEYYSLRANSLKLLLREKILGKNCYYFSIEHSFLNNKIIQQDRYVFDELNFRMYDFINYQPVLISKKPFKYSISGDYFINDSKKNERILHFKNEKSTMVFDSSINGVDCHSYFDLINDTIIFSSYKDILLMRDMSIYNIKTKKRYATQGKVFLPTDGLIGLSEKTIIFKVK